MDDLLPSLDQVGHNRSFGKGKEAFAAGQCIVCHRFGNEGGAIGPDLIAISSRFTRRDILSSIVEPSKVVSEQFQNTTFIKKDGEDVTGRILEESDKSVVLLVNPLTAARAYRELEEYTETRRGIGLIVKEGVRDLLLKREQRQFLRDEWPKVRARIKMSISLARQC